MSNIEPYMEKYEHEHHTTANRAPKPEE